MVEIPQNWKEPKLRMDHLRNHNDKTHLTHVSALFRAIPIYSNKKWGESFIMRSSLKRTSIMGILIALTAIVALLSGFLLTRPKADAAMGFAAKADLNGRDGPSLNANTVKVNMYRQNQTVTVTCQIRGEIAYESAIWDKTSDNVWVPDAYVKTGYTSFVPGLARCDDASNDAHYFPATDDLNGRNAPALTATVVTVNQYLKGDAVPVVCQATGQLAYNSTIWDKTSDGVWVPDAYVKTGSTGFASGVPKCTTTTAPTEQRYVVKANVNGSKTTTAGAAAVKVYPAGSSITITCQAIGDNISGSNIWDKTSDALWVADYYIKTGFDTFIPGMARCSDNSTASGTGYLTKTDLDGRKTKTITAAAVKTYPSGSTIKVVCQAYGQWAYGSYIWDKTSDGLWVADYYVKTGSTGFVSDMPRCDNDSPSGGPSSGGSTGGGDCATSGHGRNTGPAGSTTGTKAEKLQRVLNLALAQTSRSLSYAWGGGGKGGPSCGIASLSPGGYNDYNRFGFDCSGFTQYIFWAGAGIDIGPATGYQVNKGTRVSYSNLQIGDLLFWGDTGSTTHVAIYIGSGKMIEAAPPRGTTSVHVISVYGSHSYAIRIL
jgi:hypothetical protein